MWRRTTLLSCFETSSIPTVSLEIATEISSFAGSLDEVSADDCFDNFPDASGAPAEDGAGVGSPARMAFAYSFASKSGAANGRYRASEGSVSGWDLMSFRALRTWHLDSPLHASSRSSLSLRSTICERERT